MSHGAKHRWVRALSCQRGAQVVEFAIILPVFLMLIMGMIDFGRGYFSWIILTNGAREGARAAAVGWDADNVYTRVQAAVTGLARVDPADFDTGCPPAATAQAWCIETTNVGGARGDPVTVQLQYNFLPLAPGLSGFPSGTFILTAESTMRLE